MRATLKPSLYKTAFWLMLLLCGALTGGGAAYAQHDHGQSAHDQVKSTTTTPVKEVALPEGLSSAQSIAIDSTGRIWFTEKVGKKLAVYDPEKKEFATYSLPPSWGKMGFSNITLGPDGEIWFTVTRWIEGTEEPHILGRFSPADGYFTKYAIPHNSIPEELTVDAKGTIWFLAANKNSLYRVDPKTFALKGYPIPTPDGNPKSLAADQHGKIWFVEVTANRIGVFSPEQKRFDEVIIPTPASSPVALVNDDNGNVWFLEYKGNKVGVFNAEKATFHEYDIPNYGSLPADMVIDRKRSLLWFTQSATEAKRLGMVSINEALAENNKQENAPQSPPVTANESRVKWFVLLAAITAIATLGIWLIRKSRKNKK